MTTFLATSNEEDALNYEVSDEALETVGGNEVAGNYTLAACTGLSVCPGWIRPTRRIETTAPRPRARFLLLRPHPLTLAIAFIFDRI